jgi:hypothetical protein
MANQNKDKGNQKVSSNDLLAKKNKSSKQAKLVRREKKANKALKQRSSID